MSYHGNHQVINNYCHPEECLVYDIRWSIGDSYIACAGGDGMTSVHDVEHNQVSARLRGHDGAVKCVEWSAANRVHSIQEEGTEMLSSGM